MSIPNIPKGYHSVNASLIVNNADTVLEFLQRTFNATVKERFNWPDGRLMHAALGIGDSTVMIAEAGPECAATTASLFLYVPDADATYQRALKQGATTVMEIGDQFWGDRAGCVKDSEGNTFWIATHQEDVQPDEMKRRVENFTAEQQAKSQSPTHAHSG